MFSRLLCFLVVPTFAVVVLLRFVTMSRPQSPNSYRRASGGTTLASDDSKEEARRLWEQAIAAKGGRERLNAVRNMAISEVSSYITLKGKKNQVRREKLFVFPNRYWFLEDYGSDIFATQLHMYDYNVGVQYVGTAGDPETRLEPVTNRAKVPWLDYAPISELLETRWIKPVPVRASGERTGSMTVDVVETRIDSRRVDFAFDRQTHLPLRVTFYDSMNGNTSLHVLHLKNYVDVGGIPVSQNIMLEGERGVAKYSVQFNVEYNEDLFRRPPSAKTIGLQAWRPWK